MTKKKLYVKGGEGTFKTAIGSSVPFRFTWHFFDQKGITYLNNILNSTGTI